MANADDNLEGVQLEGGTYEIIRNRLLGHGKGLQDKLDSLNTSRKEVFGSIESALVATERVTTSNNCVPRDMIPLGHNRFLFGYNVNIGLRSETKLDDVLALYEYRDNQFHPLSLDELRQGNFEKDFQSLYKYYKDTVFSKLAVIGPNLFMVFRVGKTAKDIKTFKWALNEGQLTYIGNRSDHEFKYPAQHEFEWKRTHRDLFRDGEFPHISIEDRVFVEATGGDITFKVEDNTTTGHGIYSEPVENLDQTLDDADFFYAVVGHLILFKVTPYQENKTRYYIFNDKLEEVVRVDEIKDACVMLPEGHGLMFSNGYYLATGELKRFDNELTDMIYERRLSSGNGEDFMYVFYNRMRGDYLLMHYNIIEQTVSTPTHCHGYSLFDDGQLMFFRGDEEPNKHHAIQIWKTPFVSGEHALNAGNTDSYLFKIGNQDIVRCMSECHEILRLIYREDVYASLYLDIAKKTTDISDSYFWLENESAFNIKENLIAIHDAANGAVDEFEKVVSLQKHAKESVNKARDEQESLLTEVKAGRFDSIDTFVKTLARLRTLRGEVIALKDLRYVDKEQVETMEAALVEGTENLSQRCVKFLLLEQALAPYQRNVNGVQERIDTVSKVAEANALTEEIEGIAGELEMLIDIVSNLKIDDATQTTAIIDNISSIYATLNQAKASLKQKRSSLMSVEGAAQFNAQLKLLSQSVVNYLDLCETPEKCDEYLTKLMVQVEELEGKFADFDEFILQLSEKREELYQAFETKKLNLVEARNKKATSLFAAAQRILKGVKNRVDAMDEINDIHGYLAGDLMIEKLRDIIGQLRDLDDPVKADDLEGRLKTVREDAVRQLKDRQDLFVDGQNIIQMGRHKFSVNTQDLDLTLVRQGDDYAFHLTGTKFFEDVTDERFLGMRGVWDIEVSSESPAVYRGAYLAYQFMLHVESLSAEEQAHYDQIASLAEPEERLKTWLEPIQAFMGPRYSESYTKGVHDTDAAKILLALWPMRRSSGLLRYTPRERTFARLAYAMIAKHKDIQALQAKIQGFGLLAQMTEEQSVHGAYVGQLKQALDEVASNWPLYQDVDTAQAAEYLFHELMGDLAHMVASPKAVEIQEGFEAKLKHTRFEQKFIDARKPLQSEDPRHEYELVRDWVDGFVASLEDANVAAYTDEASLLVLRGSHIKVDVVNVDLNQRLEGLMGQHATLEDGIYDLNYNRFMQDLIAHERDIVSAYHAFQDLKHELIEDKRKDMRLGEFKPRVLSSFVRNKLIDEVYLPIVGDNLAKQVGVVGENKRTDLMGLLLLVSPPGYGKTTLMEYIANRLGIIFMKINGPAIGHQVTSLDPQEAGNASAREEVEKLNLALEMGDNVMIYLDDIQHCNPEFLQKFISLCDGQRKIEGVYNGVSQTYDLRGRKVVVVMAGNPYTESGDKFQIPDMLANRADTYNLGDIIGDTARAFEMSYLENSLTSNPVLSTLSSKSQQDVYNIIAIAERGEQEGLEFEGQYSAEELNDMVNVMKKLMKVRDVILKVNLTYVDSAAQSDDYRTEPAFKMQGSYRNMNRIAEKVLPVMNEAELTTLILSHYENESQTLTSDAAANLLKFKVMCQFSDDEENARWESIKKTFNKKQSLHGADESDPVARIVAQLSNFQDGLSGITEAIAAGSTSDVEPIAPTVTLDQALEEKLIQLLDKPAPAPTVQAPEVNVSPTVSLDTQSIKALESVISQLGQMASAVPAQAAGATTGPNDQPIQVEVMNRVPKVFMKIMQRHFEVIQNYLHPTLNQSAEHGEDLKDLVKAIKKMKATYDEVIQRLAKADGKVD